MFSIFTIHCRVSEQYSGQVRTAPGVGMWIERYQWPGGVVLKKTKKKHKWLTFIQDHYILGKYEQKYSALITGNYLSGTMSSVDGGRQNK